MPTNTYTHRGSTSYDITGPVPVTGNTINMSGGGLYNVDTSNVSVESSDPVLVSYNAGDDGNTGTLHQGGSVALHGSNNTVTADSGSLQVSELANTNKNNVINVGAGVTSFEGDDIQPSDVINLTGYTQADLDTAFANLQQHAGTESTTISDAVTGHKLTMLFKSEHGTNMPTESQFHVTGGPASSDAAQNPPQNPPTSPSGSSSGTGASQQPGPPPTPSTTTSDQSGNSDATSSSPTPPPQPPIGTPTSDQMPPASSPTPAPTTNTPTPPVNTVPVPDGNVPTPLSASEVSAMAGLSQPASKAMAFLDGGNHLGADFQNLGAAISSGQDISPFLARTVQDMKQLLTSYVSAMPELAQGVTGPGGLTLAIPGQFAADVVNAGLKAVVIGSAPLDTAYGGALTQFFGNTGSALLGHATS